MMEAIKALNPEALEALERRLIGVQERRQIRPSMAAWARYKGFEPAAHHLLIISEVEQFLEDPDLEVLLLHAPPGCAKSTYISHCFRRGTSPSIPQNNILFATHNGDFAQRWGRRVRSEITNEGECSAFPCRRPTPRPISSRCSEGGEYYAVGAGVGHQRLSCRPWACVTTCSAIVRMPGRIPSGKSAGIGTSTTLARA